MRDVKTPAESEVTEQQEIDEVKELLSVALSHLECSDAALARKTAYEAYEIDASHIETLKFLVDINLKLARYEEAIYHSEAVQELYPENPLGYILKGKVQLEMKHYRDSISTFQACLLMGYDDLKRLTKYISRAVQGLLNLGADFLESMKKLDYYEQMAELGLVLLSNKQYVITLQLMDVALKLTSNKHDVTMRIYLTQGHALYSTHQYDASLASYNSCLDLAVETGDIAHQTKAYVNMAALHVSRGNTYKALIVYEKLLDLYSRLQHDNIQCEETWSDNFIYGLYMNTSMAYKSIGNYDMAILYAQKYLDGRASVNDTQELGRTHKHLGQLHQTVGHNSEALSHYRSYLHMSKCANDKLDVTEAHSLIGSVFGAVGLWPLSSVYHDKSISTITYLLNKKDVSADEVTSTRRTAVVLHELYGDTLSSRRFFAEACKQYESMLKYCDRNILGRCRAFYKIGISHLNQSNSQHAHHYFEQARGTCEEEFSQLSHDIQLGVARSLQASTSTSDLESSRKSFLHSLTYYTDQIEECILHRKFLPALLLEKLDQSYQGLQTVLARLGCDAECLEFAEQYRQYTARLACSGKPFHRIRMNSSIQECLDIVSSQGSPVLYYSFLNDSLLMWFLSPSHGLQRFYVKKPLLFNGNVEAELQALLRPWESFREKFYKKHLFKFSSRHAERRKSNIVMKSTENRNLHSFSPPPQKEEFNQSSTGEIDEEQSVKKQLYKLLLGPVDDLISDLHPEEKLIIIPDRIIASVPFSDLRNVKGEMLADKFKVTFLPGLYALKMVMENNILRLQVGDDTKFLRQEARLGGYYKYITTPELVYSKDETHEPTDLCNQDVNRTKMANPRLATIINSEEARHKLTRTASNLYQTNDQGSFVQLSILGEPVKKTSVSSSHEGSLYSLTKPSLHGHLMDRLHKQRIKQIPQPIKSKSRSTRGYAAGIHRLKQTENLTTLVTNTSTGTDILSSSTGIPEYRQVCDAERFVVIGNPALSSQMILGECPMIPPDIVAQRSMKDELIAVCEILKCDAISDRNATKEKFIEIMQTATVLHIATLANLSQGFLLMSCSEAKLSSSHPIEERYYLVTVDDILSTRLQAKLVVISGGWTIKNQPVDQKSLMSLPTAFISAGAETVITFPNPELGEAHTDFLVDFYTSFQSGQYVCPAVERASQTVRRKYNQPTFCVMVFGNNTYINNAVIRSAMLDQKIDQVEQETKDLLNRDPLNLVPPQRLPGLKELLEALQKDLSDVCYSTELNFTEVFSALISMLETAISVTINSDMESADLVSLPAVLVNLAPAVNLLKHVGLSFMPRGLKQCYTEPAVVFPSLDSDGCIHRMLLVAKSLKHACDLRLVTVPAFADVIPTSQDLISHFVDLLCVTLHTPAIQLSVTDSTVERLWLDAYYRNLLSLIGYHQVGTLLHFNATHVNRSLAKEFLNIFLMISSTKPERLLTEFDSEQLGLCTSQQSTRKVLDQKLNTMLPVIIKHDQVVRRVPWSSRVEDQAEMNEKVKLALRFRECDKQHRLNKRGLSRLHHATASQQAREILEQHARPVTKSVRAKVISGSSASRQRVEVGYIPLLTRSQQEERRRYADFVSESSLNQLQIRHKHNRTQLLRPYADILN